MAIILISGVLSLGIIGAACAIVKAREYMND
jgi:hypothetical protein